MQISDVFRGVTKVALDNGSSSLFWKDAWFDDHDSPLMEIFPGAFSFCLNEDKPVVNILTAEDPSLIFHLPLSTQAREQVREIQQGSMHVLLDRECNDTWECNLGGTFSSKRYYDHCFRDMVADKAFGWLWNAKSPIKFKMFGWLLMVDRLNTRNMLKHRHFNVAGNVYTCMLCPSPPEETVEHLFFNCPFSQHCWDKVGILWPNSGDRLTLIHAGKEGWRRPLFMDIFLLAAWSLLKERNNLYFRRVPHSFHSWLARFKELLALLVHNCKETLRPSLENYIQSL